MKRNGTVIRVAGESGEGIVTIGGIVVRTAACTGLEVFTFRTYPAEIMGGHVVYQARIGTDRVLSDGDQIDVLVTTNQEGHDRHIGELVETGSLLFDSTAVTPGWTDDQTFGIPIAAIADELEHERGKNLIMVGAVIALFGLSLDCGRGIVRTRLGKYASLLQKNLDSLEAGHNYVREHYANRIPDAYELERRDEERLVMTGNQAIALGALAAGCRFYAGYPITPATGIMEFLAQEMPILGGKVIQTEDEISAIAVAIGASFAGQKSMTATSGPGLALMIEMLGQASMTEIPLVIVNVQRAGPATGMPTKTAQADLFMALYAGNDEAPRMVLAPDSVEDCFKQMINAFDLAETYQMPVIVLSDQALSTRVETIPLFDLDSVIPKTRLYPTEGNVPYHRYKLTESGISPMSIPGMAGMTYTAEGLEHDEHGAPNYTPEVHRAMTNKRHRKVNTARKLIQEMPVSDRWGVEGAEIGIMGWGSTKGAVREAMEQISDKGIQVEAFFTRSLLPMPDKLIREFLQGKQVVLVPENNYRGMFANVIEHRYNAEIIENEICICHLPKYDGLPFRPVDIASEIEKYAEIMASGDISQARLRNAS